MFRSRNLGLQYQPYLHAIQIMICLTHKCMGPLRTRLLGSRQPRKLGLKGMIPGESITCMLAWRMLVVLPRSVIIGSVPYPWHDFLFWQTARIMTLGGSGLAEGWNTISEATLCSTWSNRQNAGLIYFCSRQPQDSWNAE